MFPYCDQHETQRTPVVTIALIAVNILAWSPVRSDPRRPPSSCWGRSTVRPGFRSVEWQYREDGSELWRRARLAEGV
jgi:hypothetical protein